MQFYEIELLTPPEMLVAVSVQTAHYVNRVDTMSRFLEIALTLEGHAVYTFPDGHTEFVDPGMITPLVYDMNPCLIRAHNNEFQRHDTVCIGVTYRARRRNTENVDDYPRLKEDVMSGSLILIPYHEHLGERFETVHRQIQKIIGLFVSTNPGDRLHAIGEWYTMCGMLTDMVLAHIEHDTLQSPPSALRYVQNAKAFIAEHYRESICVGDIARHLGISSSYLHTLFKDITSYSPADYINRCRIEQACLLSRNTSMSLGEVAAEIGIKNPLYLSRMFKKYTGVTFSDYRKNPSVRVGFYDV